MEDCTTVGWNVIKSTRISEEESKKLNLIIEAKTETITKDEAMAMLDAVVRGS